MATIDSTGISVREPALTCRENRSGVNSLRSESGDNIERTPASTLKAVSFCLLLSFLVPMVAEASSTTSCSELAASSGWQAPEVIGIGEPLDFEALIGILADSRVVFVGESHDRYDHHLNQLEILCRLHRRNPDMVIAMEFFQQPFQAPLDDFVAGRIDTEDMLRATEYYDRWRFDYRLYAPIMTFARTHGISIIALNVPTEITTKVGLEGIESLTEEERAKLPETMDRSDERYRERIRIAFEQHPEETRGDFQRFFEVQLLWDEGMADRTARYLAEHPESRLVVLAGMGHVVRSGIPTRVVRRDPPVAVSVVLQANSHATPSLDEADGDFVLGSAVLELPSAGMLGALLGTEADGVSVHSFADGSAAEAAGMEKGDRIVELQGRPVSDFAGVKMELLDKVPGDTVSVKIERETADGSVVTHFIEVTLR
jgi:uncharacterized iron-regulated protein